MRAEHSEKIKEILLEVLDERFHGELVFSPILVKPHRTDDGFLYLDISIVYEGDRKLLTPDWYAGFIPRLWHKLEEVGIEGFPSTSLIEKSEWLSYNRRRKVASR